MTSTVLAVLMAQSLVQTPCPDIQSELYKKSAAWEAEAPLLPSLTVYTKDSSVPLVVNIPAEFRASTLQALRFFRNHTDAYLSHQPLPEKIEIYSQGSVIAGPHSKLAALYCHKFNDDPKALKLVVNDEVLNRPAQFRRVLAHELFHHLNFMAKKNWPDWLEEMGAIWAEMAATGYTVTSLMESHVLDTPWTSLSYVREQKELLPEVQTWSFYGQVQMLVHFLNRQVGPNLLGNLLTTDVSVTNPKSVESLLTAALQKTGGPFKSFRELFREFSISKYVNKKDYISEDNSQASRYQVFETETATTLKPPKADIWPWSSRVIANGAEIPHVLYPHEVVWVTVSPYLAVQVSKKQPTTGRPTDHVRLLIVYE